MERKSIPGQPGPQPPPGARYELWIYAFLILATLAVYAQVRHFDFVNYDDPDYVTDNPYVRQGVTAAGLRWALTSGDAANWFPVTRISHLLDVQIFGVDSGWHHLTSLLFHLLATLILFAFLRRATHAHWPSAFVALLFAVHPLHVESVAWIAERKDVLCALFWFLTLYAHLRYTERPGPGRYALALAAFSLGLMSKPMIVTLPFVLLLLDFWPLGRLAVGLRRLLVEKVPFFVLTGVAAVVTYAVQQRAGAVAALAGQPLWIRVANALDSYVVYIVQTVWPSGLAAFYPYARELPAWQPVLAGLALLAVTALVLRRWRTSPYLAVGWLWYLGTLVPVIGLVQVGAQAHADRYMYIPMVGLAIMLAWGGAEIVRRRPAVRIAIVAAAATACLALAVVSVGQAQYWQSSEVLFRHALSVADSSVAHNNLGNFLAQTPGRLPEAIAEYEAALRIAPDHAEAHNNLGAALLQTPGRQRQAIDHLEAAVRLKPDYAEAHSNLGSALMDQPGRLQDAIAQYQAALRIRPDYEEAHNNLGSALARIPDRLPEAIAQYEAALRIDPADAEAHYNLGTALSRTPGRTSDAIAQFQAALRLRPDLKPAQQWLDRLRAGAR